MLDRAYNLVQIGDTSTLARALSIASLFMNPSSPFSPYQGSINFYTVNADQTLLTPYTVAVTRTAQLLTIGTYQFSLQGNLITGMKKECGTLLRSL